VTEGETVFLAVEPRHCVLLEDRRVSGCPYTMRKAGLRTISQEGRNVIQLLFVFAISFG